ncbi:hypothetical protein [Nostoc commune]|uniref:hypothetical protein n=1 Tax=Nostoc commune TaxID=1178 RepID=UPI00396AA603
MLVGGTHFSTIGNGNPANQQVALPADMIGDASQARRLYECFEFTFLPNIHCRKAAIHPLSERHLHSKYF